MVQELWHSGAAELVKAEINTAVSDALPQAEPSPQTHAPECGILTYRELTLERCDGTSRRQLNL
jgi:hypothetical protein